MKIMVFALACAIGLSGALCAQVCTTTLTAPSTETFDGATQMSSSSCGTSGFGTYPTGWSLDPASTNAWRVDSSGTSSSSTGPSDDITTGGNYLYVETSSPCSGQQDTAILNSPCFDVSGLPNNANLDYWYHLFGSDIGTLTVESWAGSEWFPVFSVSGDQGNMWVNVQAPLYTFDDGGTQTARVRFVSEHSGNGFTGDMAIDQIGVVDGMLTPPPLEWETNSPELAIDINDVQAARNTPAIVSGTAFNCGGSIDPATGVLNISSNLAGNPFDMVVTQAGCIGGMSGGIALPDGQFVNVDLTQPFVFLSSGTNVPGSLSLPFANFPGSSTVDIQIGFAITTATSICIQGVVVDMSAPLGFHLSQATELNVTVASPPAQVPGPSSDNTNLTLDVTTAPTCWCPGGIPFYGTLFTSMNVSPNGRILFGGTDTDSSPSISQAQGDNPFVGFWTDLDPADGGSIVISNPMSNVVRVDWQGVPYDGGGSPNTFGVSFNCQNGVVTIDGLQGLSANTTGTFSTDDQFLGMSPGNLLGATDPGGAGFALGANGLAAATTDMLYEFNDVSISGAGLFPFISTGGLDTLTFTPDGLGNYTWVGM